MVVAILAILAAMAAPSPSQTSPTQLRAAADMLAADLNFAQIESITHSHDPCALVVTADGYHLARQSDFNTPLTNPVGKTPYVCNFGAGRASALTRIAIDSHDFDGDDELVFGPYGQLDQMYDATITLIADGGRITLTLHSVTGEVTISDLH